MNSLLSINESMNIFSLSVHAGDRPLYKDLIKLGESYPDIIDEIDAYPLKTIAIERDELEEYANFENSLSSLSSSKNNVQGPKLGQ